MSMTTKLAVDIREAAAMLSVSPRTIANYIHAGLLRSRKIGKRRLVTVKALEDFLATDRQSPVPHARMSMPNARAGL
jgi:excisionase family DNA binding protein